jgi:alpha-N-arabinofuranosidase
MVAFLNLNARSLSMVNEEGARLVAAGDYTLLVGSEQPADRRTLTVAVLNPTDVDRSLTLKIAGASLTGKGPLSRLAPNGDDIQHPDIVSSPVDSVPDSLTLPRYSINIYELTAK